MGLQKVSQKVKNTRPEIGAVKSACYGENIRNCCVKHTGSSHMVSLNNRMTLADGKTCGWENK